MTCCYSFMCFICLALYLQSSDEDILASLRELEEALCETGPIERSDGQMRNSSFHQECLYYLNTYGTHLALIDHTATNMI